MLCITRKELPDKKNRAIYNMQLHTALANEGMEYVVNWCEWGQHNVFSMKAIVIISHIDYQWSLCTIYNTELLNPEKASKAHEVDVDEDPFHFILHPLDINNRVVISRNICSWINAPWNRKQHDSHNIFNNVTTESFSTQGMLVCILQLLCLFFFFCPSLNLPFFPSYSSKAN